MNEAQQRLIGVLQALISRRQPVLEGCRMVLEAAAHLEVEPHLLTTFAAVDSESEELRLGSERAAWVDFDEDGRLAEAARYAGVVESEVVEAAKRLLAYVEAKS